MPMIIGGAGFGVETGFDFYVQVKLQQCADAGAFGCGAEMSQVGLVGGRDVDAGGEARFPARRES
jgi:hypothetical protein